MQTPHRRNGTDHLTAPDLPVPGQGARWRWAVGRRALIGGAVLSAVLSAGPVAASAASTTHVAKPPAGARHMPARGRPKPTVAGKITALSGDDITIDGRGSTTQKVVYSASTTLWTSSGSTTSAHLEVGQFIAVIGTEAHGTVTATSIMIGLPPTRAGGPPGRGGGPPPRNRPSARPAG